MSLARRSFLSLRDFGDKLRELEAVKSLESCLVKAMVLPDKVRFPPAFVVLGILSYVFFVDVVPTSLIISGLYPLAE